MIAGHNSKKQVKNNNIGVNPETVIYVTKSHQITGPASADSTNQDQRPDSVWSIWVNVELVV